jgi:uncharacterized membrane protein
VAEPRRPGDRLDTPRALRRQLVRRPSYDTDAFGVFAERFARFMGTAKFLIWMTVVVFCWVVWNALAPDDARFDEFPFIFLTLALSLQASYAAPLILLAQNRQEDRDRVIATQDREAAARTPTWSSSRARSPRCGWRWARSRPATTCGRSSAPC